MILIKCRTGLKKRELIAAPGPGNTNLFKNFVIKKKPTNYLIKNYISTCYLHIAHMLGSELSMC